MLVLPDDIVLLIGDLLEGHQDRYNSIFVCRRFHHLFSRTLYRSADLRDCSQIQSFLRALLLRRHLALVVKSLDFQNWRPKPTELSFDDLAIFSTWAKSISHSEQEHAQWERDLRHGVAEAWIALLLPLVSNLRQLRLVYPRDSVYLDRTFLRAMNMEKPFHDQPAFHRLEEVSLSHMEDDVEDMVKYLPSQMMPFFRMPSMRIFSADSVVEPRPTPADGQEQVPKDSEPGCSGISEITLNTSNGCQGMETLLASCSSLTSFKYQHTDRHLSSQGFQPAAFFRSLARSRASLQTLWLDNCGDHAAFTIAGLNQTCDTWFGPLTDFTALKELRIRYTNLLDVHYQAQPSVPLTDILPQSVEGLYIEDCRDSRLPVLLEQLKMLLDTRDTRFASLRRLDIEGYFHDEDADESSGKAERVIKPGIYAKVEPFRVACAEAGIQLFLRDRWCPQTMLEQ